MLLQMLFLACSAVEPKDALFQLHELLGHPEYARLYNFTQARNLLYTSEETKHVCKNLHRLCGSQATILSNQKRDIGKSYQTMGTTCDGLQKTTKRA